MIPNVKEMLFRLLADKDAREQAFSFLIEQFEEVGDAQRGNLRWVVGLAIGQMSHVVDLPVLHRLAEKTEYGSGRQEIVVGIGKLGNDTSIDVLTGLVDDPSVALPTPRLLLRQLSRTIAKGC